MLTVLNLRLIVAYLMGGSQIIECPLKSVSEIIRHCDLKEVNLLKIDVERGELKVLRGISSHDWPKVQQVAVEVHQKSGNFRAVQDLLLHVGFRSVVAEQDIILEGSGLVNVYAKR